MKSVSTAAGISSSSSLAGAGAGAAAAGAGMALGPAHRSRVPNTVAKSALANAPELRLDSDGKVTFSAAQEAARSVRQTASLRINRAAAKNRIANPYLAHRVSHSDKKPTSSASNDGAGLEDEATAAFHDERIVSSSKVRRREQALRFVPAGTFIKRAQRAERRAQRAANRLDQQGKVAQVHRIEMDDANGSTAPGDAPDSSTPEDVVPPISASLTTSALRAERAGCEWWDLPFLPKERRTLLQGVLRGRKLTAEELSGLAELGPGDFKLRRAKTWNLVEHPAALAPVGEAPDPGPQPLRLTERERKKIRRQRRKEQQQELQDKIRLGLIEPPDPKMKISNMMRVLGEEAVANPSLVERKARAQMAERQQDHEMRNLARKLTPAERREKNIAKLQKDRVDAEASGIGVAVFRISGELVDPRQRFKIDMNARQLYLTGVCLIVEHGSRADTAPVNMVLIEGGRKAIKKFKRLLLKRIAWPTVGVPAAQQEAAAAAAAAAAGPEESEQEPEKPLPQSRWPMSCSLVWEGSLQASQFQHFRLEEVSTPTGARSYSKRRGCEYLWDMVASS